MKKREGAKDKKMTKMGWLIDLRADLHVSVSYTHLTLPTKRIV